MFGTRSTFEWGHEADGIDPFAGEAATAVAEPHADETDDTPAVWEDADPVAFEAASIGDPQLTLDELATTSSSSASGSSKPRLRDARAGVLVGVFASRLDRWRRLGAVVGMSVVVVIVAGYLIAAQRGGDGEVDGPAAKRPPGAPASPVTRPRVPGRPYERPIPRRPRRPRPTRMPAPRIPAPARTSSPVGSAPTAAGSPATPAAAQEFGFER